MTNRETIIKLAKRYSETEIDSYEELVRNILRDVKLNGDKALKEYNLRFDNYSGPLRIELDQVPTLDSELEEALLTAKLRIEKFHHEELRANKLLDDWSFTGDLGERLGVQHQALNSVAVYIPGGKACLLSTVLMTVIPAKIAGVPRIVMLSPAQGERSIDPAVLRTAKLAGVDEVYAIGGAQAIAALAYGSETIKPVDKIVGPGNIFVSLAKKQVFGKVGIDGIYGPSELAIVADDKAKTPEIAADILSQLEHGSGLESSLVICFSQSKADEIQDHIFSQIEELRKHKNQEQIETIISSFSKWSAILLAKDLSEAAELINLYAPEHLELMLEPSLALSFSKSIVNAGAIFIGSNSCESLGDYLAGPSHCLPTAGTARFSSGLQSSDFIKRTSIIDFSKVQRKDPVFQELILDVAVLARAEKLEAHARAMEKRREDHA